MGEFVPQRAPGYLPFLYGGPVDDSAVDPPAPLHFRTFKLPPNDPDVLAYGPNGVIGWELKIDDLRGGYMQSGDFARGANPLDGDYRMTSSSTLDQRWRRHLMLTNLEAAQSLPGTNGTGSFYCHMGENMWFARGNAVNATLWAEWVAFGSFTSTPWTPGSRVSGMAPVVIGGVSNAERLAMMQETTPIDIVDITGASSGLCHANLTPCFGLLFSPINATSPGTGSNLWYANGGIWTTPISAAIGAAPVQVLSNIPNGGFAVGVEKLPKGPLGLRAYWGWPLQNSNTSILNDSTTARQVPVRIISTNMEGTDPLPVPMPVSRVIGALFWRRNLVVHDYARVIVHDGDTSRDLHILASRPRYDGHYSVTAIAATDNDLYAVILKTSQTGTFDGMWVEQYQPQFDSWLAVSKPITTNLGTGLTDPTWSAYLPHLRMTSKCASLPVSRFTSLLHIPGYDPTVLPKFFLSPAGQNPYYLFQQSPGGGTANKLSFAADGTWTGPWWEFPDLEGRWKRADQVIFLGDIEGANADAYVTVALNGDPPVTFAPGLPHVNQLGETGTRSLFQQLQVAISVYRGSNAYKTPNAMPVMIRGRAYIADTEAQFVAGVPTGP